MFVKDNFINCPNLHIGILHIKFVITNSKIVKEGIHADVIYVITGQFLQ